jgi:hypothetical protein
MQKMGLSITLQQLKMKVTKVTQTRITPFKYGVPGSSWWFWFKLQHPKFNIQ